jgi:hypothetical protein
MKLLERNDLHMQDDPTDLLALMKKESWKIGGVGGRRT